MNNDAIGVFDSGLGGLTCVGELKKLMPNENIIYFGDTARVPYGTRSKDTIKKYAAQDIAFLKQFNVKMIIAACNTVSSVVGMNKDFTGDTPFTGVLLPSAQAACGMTRTGRVGVIATSATIKTGAYGKAIRSIKPDISVIGNSCPLLVPIVENGFGNNDNQIARLAVEHYLKAIKDENVDTLILGCTHYPILSDVIADYMGDGVRLISSGAEAAKQAFSYLTRHEMLADSKQLGNIKFYVSDSIEMFNENASLYFDESIDNNVYKVDIEELSALG